jgi:K+-transporting ATPase KdpF subunit
MTWMHLAGGVTAGLLLVYLVAALLLPERFS